MNLSADSGSEMPVCCCMELALFHSIGARYRRHPLKFLGAPAQRWIHRYNLDNTSQTARPHIEVCSHSSLPKYQAQHEGDHALGKILCRRLFALQHSN